MELGRETAESIQRIEGEVYNRVSLGNMRLGQRDECYKTRVWTDFG